MDITTQELNTPKLEPLSVCYHKSDYKWCLMKSQQSKKVTSVLSEDEREYEGGRETFVKANTKLNILALLRK